MSIREKMGKSFQTVAEMFHDRQFLTPEELEVLASLSDKEIAAFSQKGAFNIDIGSKLRIIYFMGKFQIQAFKAFFEDEFDLYVAVMGTKLTTNNIKSIHEMEKKLASERDTQINMQFFVVDELLFNITKHVLVPKHEVITDEKEIAGLVERYNVKSRHQFPLILKSDPVAKYYGIKPGQVVKITRVSPSAGEYVMYRCCV